MTLPSRWRSRIRFTRLWWVLIVEAIDPLVALSITSGYNVPCASNSTFAAASKKTSTKRSPIRRRFSSGSSTPSSFARNRALASTTSSSAPGS